MIHENYATVINVKNWKNFYETHDEIFENNRIVLYRGLKNEKWDLLTSLDRFGESGDYDLRKVENIFLREFKRRYHNYSIKMPEKSNRIEWLALMQHYGTPTRLLDWTYSFYVAVFFALEDLENNEDVAVWAIDATRFKQKLNLKFPALAPELIKDPYLENVVNFKKFDTRSIVLRINPYYLHERLSIQQGCFLLPGDVTQPFSLNLINFFGSQGNLKKYLFKFVIRNSDSIRKEILEDLYRMNISRASLFPGLDGFATSLKTIAYALPSILV